MSWTSYKLHTYFSNPVPWAVVTPLNLFCKLQPTYTILLGVAQALLSVLRYLLTKWVNPLSTAAPSVKTRNATTKIYLETAKISKLKASFCPHHRLLSLLIWKCSAGHAYFHPGIKFNKENPKRAPSPYRQQLASNQEPGVLKNSHFTCAKSTTTYWQPGQEQQAAERRRGLQITKQLQLENTAAVWRVFQWISVSPGVRSSAQWLDVLKSITLCPSPISRIFPSPEFGSHPTLHIKLEESVLALYCTGWLALCARRALLCQGWGNLHSS